MTIDFDFDAPVVSADYSACPGGGTNTTLVTIPLASSPFPLQAGRAVMIVAEFAGNCSDGTCQANTILAMAGYSSGVQLTQSAGATLALPNVTASSHASNGGMYISGGDLVVYWYNGDPTATVDASVRVRCRWFGS